MGGERLGTRLAISELPLASFSKQGKVKAFHVNITFHSLIRTVLHLRLLSKKGKSNLEQSNQVFFSVIRDTAV